MPSYDYRLTVDSTDDIHWPRLNAEGDVLCPICGHWDVAMWADDGEADLSDWWQCERFSGGCGAHGAVLLPDKPLTQNGLEPASASERKKMLPAELPTPALIDHTTFVGLRQIKRVDSVELNIDTDARVRDTLGVGDLDRPLARLKGDTVDIDGNPVGAIRGWQTYVYADEPLDVLR